MTIYVILIMGTKWELDPRFPRRTSCWCTIDSKRNSGSSYILNYYPPTVQGFVMSPHQPLSISLHSGMIVDAVVLPPTNI